MARSKCRENRQKLLKTFKQKVKGIKCSENLKIKILREFRVANYCKGNKSV